MTDSLFYFVGGPWNGQRRAIHRHLTKFVHIGNDPYIYENVGDDLIVRQEGHPTWVYRQFDDTFVDRGPYLV